MTPRLAPRNHARNTETARRMALVVAQKNLNQGGPVMRIPLDVVPIAILLVEACVIDWRATSMFQRFCFACMPTNARQYQ